MSLDPDYFSKFNLWHDPTSLSLDLNEKEIFNIFNENDLSENKNSSLEGPTNYNTDIIDVYSFERINRIFQKYKTINFEQILNNFIYDSHMEDAENRFMGKKRKRSYNYTTNIESMKYSKRKGRKEKTDTSHRPHNKNTSDNIIKKIKSKLFENILQFINNILIASDISINIDEKKKILKDIDYKYINRLNKEYDLNLLNSSIKDLLSFKVSDKFKCGEDFNKNLIKELIIQKNDNKFLMFALNMKFREWLDLFTLKIEFKEFSETFAEELNKNMTKVKDMIEDVYSKNKDRNYISSFIFYLYNYENWFIMKRSKKFEIKCPSSF